MNVSWSTWINNVSWNSSFLKGYPRTSICGIPDWTAKWINLSWILRVQTWKNIIQNYSSNNRYCKSPRNSQNSYLELHIAIWWQGDSLQLSYTLIKMVYGYMLYSDLVSTYKLRTVLSILFKRKQLLSFLTETTIEADSTSTLY